MKYDTVKFRVVPKGTFMYDFPIDMLRYDHCSPASEEDSAKIINTLPRNMKTDKQLIAKTEIELSHFGDSKWQPTEGRWESFGWKVVSPYDY